MEDVEKDTEKTRDAKDARQHAQNKRDIVRIAELLLERSKLDVNIAWLTWFRALRTCVDGKKDDIADALCQGFYDLRDKLESAAKLRAKLARRNAKDASTAVELPPVLTELRASSCDIGFKNLAFCVLRVFVDASTVADDVLRGANFEVLRWERVDCLALAGVSGIDVNATNMHRLTEILMCGIAARAHAMFGLPAERLDYVLLESQKGGGGRAGTNAKTFAASHILQACCMLHYAQQGKSESQSKCPIVDFVSSAKKTQDAGALPLLFPVLDDDATLQMGNGKRKRALKGVAAAIRPDDAFFRDDESSISASIPISSNSSSSSSFCVQTDGLAWRASADKAKAKTTAKAKAKAKEKEKADKAHVLCDTF
jgi:hypothetical protein